MRLPVWRKSGKLHPIPHVLQESPLPKLVELHMSGSTFTRLTNRPTLLLLSELKVVMSRFILRECD